MIQLMSMTKQSIFLEAGAIIGIEQSKNHTVILMIDGSKYKVQESAVDVFYERQEHMFGGEVQ